MSRGRTAGGVDSVRDLERRAGRQRVAEESLGRCGEPVGVLARRDADRHARGRARDERRVPETRLAADDPGDVERRLDEGADVEVVRRLGVERDRAHALELLRPRREPGPVLELLVARRRDALPERLRQPAVAGEERSERLRERVDRVQRRPAVVAGVEVALARSDVEVERDQAARREHELGRVPALHPAVEDEARVRRAVVGSEKARDRVAARLLLAVADDPEAHRQRSLLDERLDGLQLHPELALVVRDAACVEPLAARLGRERVAIPELERVHGCTS